MASSSAPAVVASALAVLHSASNAGVPDDASEALQELSELVALRERVIEDIAHASRSTDVIVTNLLADQLRGCVREIDQRLHAATKRAELLLRKSA